MYVLPYLLYINIWLPPLSLTSHKLKTCVFYVPSYKMTKQTDNKEIPKNVRKSVNNFYHQGGTHNLRQTKEYLHTLHNPSHTKFIIAQYAKDLGIEFELSKEFWTNIADVIQNDWESFLQFLNNVPEEHNLLKIKRHTKKEFSISDPRSNMGTYALHKLNIPRFEKTIDGVHKDKDVILDYYEHLADKIVDNGVDKFYDFISIKMNRKKRKSDKRKSK